MLRHNAFPIAVLGVTALLLISCSSNHDSVTGETPSMAKGGDDKVLNLFWWSDFLGPNTITEFEKQTGIKVTISYFDSEEALETRMLTGKSGFDVVVPGAPYFFQREMRSGAFLTLNKQELPNLRNLDPAIMAKVAVGDPDNAHGVVFIWGTIGIGYNQEKVSRALPGVAMNSWRVIFNPASAEKLAKCGIEILDSPVEVVALVMRYLGRDPDSRSTRDLDDVQRVLMGIRPYVRNIDTSGYIEAIANGDVCAVVGYNGDIVQARRRAAEANNGARIAYALPLEGSVLYFSMLAIPRDASHTANAHRFVNYLMKPEVIAEITNFLGYANANVAATPLLDSSIINEPATYPSAVDRERLSVPTDSTPEEARAITRLWQKFKSGQ